MIPESTSVKVDSKGSEFHGEVGFVLQNHKSGVVEPCDECATKKICEKSDCEEGEQLPEGFYRLVFSPMDYGGFAHCSEWFSEDDLVVRGC
jgi:hypothetical protein